MLFSYHSPVLPPSLLPSFPPFLSISLTFLSLLLSLPPHTIRNPPAALRDHHPLPSAALTVGEEEEEEEEGLRGVEAVRVCRRGTWHN